MNHDRNQSRVNCMMRIIKFHLRQMQISPGLLSDRDRERLRALVGRFDDLKKECTPKPVSDESVRIAEEIHATTIDLARNLGICTSSTGLSED